MVVLKNASVLRTTSGPARRRMEGTGHVTPVCASPSAEPDFKNIVACIMAPSYSKYKGLLGMNSRLGSQTEQVDVIASALRDFGHGLQQVATVAESLCSRRAIHDLVGFVRRPVSRHTEDNRRLRLGNSLCSQATVDSRSE